MKKVRILQLILLVFLLALNAMGQSNESIKKLRKGNAEFEKKDYKNAEISYRKAIEKSDDYYKAKYNLATSLYKQGNYEEAAKLYTELAHNSIDSTSRAKNFHNLGNAQFMQKKYEESIISYKNALKSNPNDNDTRYNLAYAQKMLQKQKQENKKDQNQKEKNKDQQKDQKQNDKKEDEKKNDKQNGENQKDKDKKSTEPNKQKQNKLDKKDADKMLQAMQQKEKNTKEKLDKQKVKVVPITIEKDW